MLVVSDQPCNAIGPPAPVQNELTPRLRVPLHEPGLVINPGQLTRCGKKQVLFTRARVASLDHHPK